MAKRKPAVPIATPTPAPLPRARVPQWAPVAALAALALAVYANSIGNGFIGDDQFQLLRNPLLRDFGSIPRIFGSSVWSFLGVTGNYYRPLQFLVYLFIAQIAGLHAPAFHAFMVVLHAVNVALLYFFVRRMASGPIAWASAALFAVHPIHTEPVDWIAALPDLMLTATVLAGVLC